MAIKIGINGLGRIGRMIVRSIIESNNKNLIIKHINNRTNSEACSALLKYDSIHGKFKADISFDNNHLIINKKKITFDLHGYSLDEANKKDFKIYVNSALYFHPHNMFICRSKDVLESYYDTVFPWLERCEKIFGFNVFSSIVIPCNSPLVSKTVLVIFAFKDSSCF